MSVLIWIQNVLHSDVVPERISMQKVKAGKSLQNKLILLYENIYIKPVPF